MSGGFFRGTSAAQDTRFSNKQAKLLKSQKFAPELDQLVDMKKVKMDVIRPWIATRATEFLGFEDEVLINFIYGLLDGKEVDGKQIQIQLTGFMEKNTGKFMKELWSLLLSAQKNASGVPQQFLDAKEEETKKKKAEADRITLELQKKKEREGRELEWEHHKKMDGEMDVSRTTDTVAVAKNSLLRVSEDREVDSRHGSEGNNRLSKSPHAVHRSPSPRRSASRSRSKSFSNSRSYSRSPYSSERRESRSLSGSPQPRRRSPSLGRQHRSPIHSPRRRHSPRYPRSPTRRRSPHIRRRSPSPVRRRSPSPIHHRSPSPVRRRSPSPVRRRSPSPVRCRSPSPVRRRPRTPPRRRSPSPIRRRSPSPLRRRSPPPFRRRSPSPFRRRSPSPFQRRSPSPMRRSPLARSPRYRRRSPMGSPRRRAVDSQVSPRQRKRSRSPYGSHSPYKSRRSLSRERDGRINGLERRRYRDDHASQRSRAKRSPDHHALEREGFERPGGGRKGPESISHQPPISLRSPQRDVKARTDSRIKVSTLSSPPEESPSQSESPPRVRKINPDKVRRKPSPVESPVRPTWERAIRHDSPEIRGKEAEKDPSRENQIRRDDSLKNRLKHSLTDGNRNKSPAKVVVQEYFPLDYSKSRKKDNELRSGGSPRLTDSAERTNQQASYALKEIEYGPGRLEEENFSPSSKRFGRVSFSPDERFSIRQVSLKKSYSREGYEVDEKKQPISSNVKHRVSEHKSDTLQTSMKWMEPNNQVGPLNMDGEEAEIYRSRDTDKRKGKRQESLEVAWNNEAGHASPIDERKEAKRRKKEEKRFRKEERRRRREERHRRREERYAGKLKSKSVATVMPPSDFEKLHSDAEDSEDGDVAIRKTPHPSDTEEAESEQKRLEIELRKKALESLRAKKAISH